MTIATTSSLAAQSAAGTFEPDSKLASIVTRYIPPTTPCRVLDVECGDGNRCYTVARALPAAVVGGVDRDRKAIASALSRRGREEGSERVAFTHGDYLGQRHEPVDLILADSRLEQLDGVRQSETRRDALFAKISRELSVDGLLILTLPSASLLNRLLWFARDKIYDKIRVRGSSLADIIPESALRHDESLKTFLRAVCHLDFVAQYPLQPDRLLALRMTSAVFRKRPEE